MVSIRSLPAEIIQLMAAGEVIESPAAVVRELAENAIDAGASRITLKLRSQPWFIQMTDNGCGLSVEDLRQAATAHSTSKLSNKADLWNIRSLGFRGEALHSLSRLARLTLCSRPQVGADSGFCVTCDRTGRPTALTPVAMAAGTCVTVEDLFYPLPTRQQAAAGRHQAMRQIQQVIHYLALCHPQITWQGYLDERTWLTVWPGESAQQVLPRIQGSDLREIQVTVPLPRTAPGQLYLLLGLPNRCHRHRPDGMIVALNGRPVQMPELTDWVLARLRRTLPRDRYPVAFLHLSADPRDIDWHRSPDKSRVFLQHWTHWKAAIAQAIDTLLQRAAVDLPVAAEPHRLKQLLRLAEPGASYGSSLGASQASQKTEATEAAAPPGLALTALAQVHNRYILAEHPAGLCLIEQHIAHERVIYESLCDRWQLVDLPEPVVLSQLSPDQVTQLERIGLTVDPFGPGPWAVRTAPAPLAQRADCADALWELSLQGDWESALVATACRTAIRNGVPLDLSAMQRLLNAWQRTRTPQTCPHGRPICLTLNESSLARYFRRS